MSEHTPGKLEVLDDRRISVTLPSLIEGCGYSSHCVALTFGGDARVNSHANARRLVAAWNACEGISTEALEVGPLMAAFERVQSSADKLGIEADSLRAVNAELLEALENIMQHIGSGNHHPDGEWVTEPIHIEEVNAARAAIASARKQENPHG